MDSESILGGEMTPAQRAAHQRLMEKQTVKTVMKVGVDPYFEKTGNKRPGNRSKAHRGGIPITLRNQPIK